MTYPLVFVPGRWILPLDSDDMLAPSFFKRVVEQIARQKKSLIDPGRYNVIVPDMGDMDGKYVCFS
jgi:hypothetical protein